jgi:uncharacterized protein
MIAVRDNVDASRFEVEVDGQVGFLDYERHGNEMSILHTEVPPALRGRGLGTLLAKTALDTARESGMRLKVICPFVRAYMRNHPAPS